MTTATLLVALQPERIHRIFGFSSAPNTIETQRCLGCLGWVPAGSKYGGLLGAQDCDGGKAAIEREPFPAILGEIRSRVNVPLQDGRTEPSILDPWGEIVWLGVKRPQEAARPRAPLTDAVWSLGNPQTMWQPTRNHQLRKSPSCKCSPFSGEKRAGHAGCRLEHMKGLHRLDSNQEFMQAMIPQNTCSEAIDDQTTRSVISVWAPSHTHTHSLIECPIFGI